MAGLLRASANPVHHQLLQHGAAAGQLGLTSQQALALGLAQGIYARLETLNANNSLTTGDIVIACYIAEYNWHSISIGRSEEN